MLSLVYADNKRPVVMKMKENLFQVVRSDTFVF
jgi:hypothetical protein